MLSTGELTITLARDCAAGAQCCVVRRGTEPRSRCKIAVSHDGRNVRAPRLSSEPLARQRDMAARLRAATPPPGRRRSAVAQREVELGGARHPRAGPGPQVDAE